MAAARTVVVVGATGGCGASVLAALLARRAAARGRAALVDLDRSGGLDVLLGLESVPGPRWPDLAHLHGRVDPDDLASVLPRWQGVEVVSAGRGPQEAPADAAVAVLLALSEGCGTVVVDLPATRAAPWTRDLLAAADHRLLVAGRDVRGVAGALAARELVPDADDPAGLVLAGRRGRVAPLEAADLLGLPLVGLLPRDRRLPGAVERGLGPLPAPWSALARAVRRVDRAVGGG